VLQRAVNLRHLTQLALNGVSWADCHVFTDCCATYTRLGAPCKTVCDCVWYDVIAGHVSSCRPRVMEPKSCLSASDGRTCVYASMHSALVTLSTCMTLEAFPCRCAVAQLTLLQSLSVAGALTDNMELYQKCPVYKYPAEAFLRSKAKKDKWCLMADVWRTIAAHTALRELCLTHLRVSTADSWRTVPANDLFRLVPAYVSNARGMHPALDWTLPPFRLTSLELSGVAITYQHLRQQVHPFRDSARFDVVACHVEGGSDTAWPSL
jgi:hypothetical protein